MRSTNLLEHVYLCLRKYSLIWMALMIFGFVASVAYNKLLATKTYTARQSLILRDDLMGDAYKPSRFESQEQLKSAQETVLEIARKPQVIKAVLEQLGPTSSFSFGTYPSAETIEDVQGNITLAAPNGAEFGKTEAVVLSVKTVDPERSRKFVNLLLDQIDSKLNEVRLLRLESMRNELSQASVNAMQSLKTASRRLQDLEKSFGADITTIRGLNDPQGSGGFDLKLNQIRLEQRQAAAQLASAKNQRALLLSAEKNGGVEFVSSNELLELQPALRGMMTNLSAAMAQLAINEGRYTSLHPELQRSRRAVKQQKQQLFNSIGTTIKGLDSQIQTLGALEKRLGQAVVKLEKQLENLTEQRVPYATLEEEVKKKAEVYNEVQGRLAQVQSYASSKEEVAMLTRVDEPQVNSRPDQIGAFQSGVIGGAIGLICGLGLVALLAPPFVDPRTYAAQTEVNPSQVPPTAQRQTSPLAAANQPTASSKVPAETAAESRLRSVTAMQRTAAQRASQPMETVPVETVSPASSLMANALDSVIPDSVAKHMAALKQGVADGANALRRESKPEKAVQPPAMETRAPKAEAAPPVKVPVVAKAPQPAQAAQTLGGKLAKSIEVSKREPSRVGDAAAMKPSSESGAPAKNQGAPTAASVEPKVSSADVIAAFKNLRESKDGQAGSGAPSTAAEIAKAPTRPSSSTGKQNTNSGSAAKESVAQRRPTLSSFANSSSVSPSQVADKNPVSNAGNQNLRPSEKTIESPDIVVVDRIRSPKVPESITSGRITAESLLSLSDQKKDSDPKISSDKPAKKRPPATSSPGKFSAMAHQPLPPKVPQGGIETADDAGSSSSRIPSITDYARSLDRKLGSEGGESIALSSAELKASELDEDASASQRSSNVRPLDIARSFDDPSTMREAVQEVQPSEADVESTQVRKPRAETISDLVGSMDNSVAGLMRAAKGSSMLLDTPANVSSVAPSEKKAPASTTNPKLREEIASAAIPAQIRELSGSFSSFARPSNLNG